MDHVAIMKKSWGLTNKILTGQKTVETRWYKSKYAPFDRITAGETVYFKESGAPVTVKAKVARIEQFSNLDRAKISELLKKYGHADLGTIEIKQKILEHVTGKSYCVIIHLAHPHPVKPFQIDKTGYGAMSSWICVDKIDKIKKTNSLDTTMAHLSLKELTAIIMQQARTKGFGTSPGEINVAEKIALIHSEVSEAFEAYRHKNIDGKDGFKEELGDAIQRILHLCGIFDIDIEEEILKKVDYNKNRKWDWQKMNETHAHRQPGKLNTTT